MIWDFFIAPFAQSEPLRRALVATVILAVSAGPVGVFLMLRRMSLTGDALSHAVLPGVAVASLLAGLAVIPMTIGALVAGLVVALMSGLVTRLTRQREDSNFAAFYLISLALGVLLVSFSGGELDLDHVLFGDVLALMDDSLVVVGITSSLSLVGMALIWRPLVAECLDASFLGSVSRAGPWAHLVFLVLVVLNLVGGYQAMGSLLAVGLMMLPAAAARLWTSRLETTVGLATGIAIMSAIAGLLLGAHLGFEAEPCIILVAGAAYLISLLVGRRESLLARRSGARHKTA